jgi:23S rRNA pseudouridine1911/1915/1917 synthase
MRTDYWLRKKYPELSRRHIEEALERRLIKSAEGRPLVKGAMVPANQPPDCTLLDNFLKRLGEGNSTLQVPVILETAELVVVDKPPGTPSHPVSLFDSSTITNWAIARYPEILLWANKCQPTITPHRLDTDTSGILLVARTGEAYAIWRRRFSEGKVEKRYLAWCWGQGPSGLRTIDAAMAHDRRDPRKMLALDGQNVAHAGARRFPASTDVRTIHQLADRFLCELMMHTGVTHQIRVHMAMAGTPLLGDKLYNPLPADRVEQFPHTLLRCTALQCDRFSVSADTESFRRQF